MNEITTSSPLVSKDLKGTIMQAASRIDSKTLLILGGMTLTSIVICVGIVSLTGSELSISRNGFSVTQPKTA